MATRSVTDRMNNILKTDRMNKTLKTAASVEANKEYWRRYNQIEQDLKQLQKMLESHGKQQRANPSNWAFVGDLGYIIDNLGEILDSFSVSK